MPPGSRSGVGKTEGKVPHESPAAPWRDQPPNPRLILLTLLWAGPEPPAQSSVAIFLPVPPPPPPGHRGLQWDGDRAGTAPMLDGLKRSKFLF